ncbi:MAG: cytochrome c [Terracidiphilus sp.]
MLKSSLLIFAAVLIAAVCLPLAGRNPQAAPAQTVPPGNNPVKPTAESQAQAKVIYKRDCALCHGDTGNGKSDLATSMSLTLDDWTDAKTLAGKPDSDLFAVIRKGKGQMPTEDSGRADDTEVWNLIIYIRSLSKAPAAPATASSTN